MFGQALLLIFKAVAQLGAGPWLGERKKSGNYFNGVLILSLIEMGIINNIYIIITWYTYFRYPKSVVIPLLMFTALVAANHAWIINLKRGEMFINSYDRFDDRSKLILKSISLALCVFSLVGFLIIDPR